jgi:hypothetical protein
LGCRLAGDRSRKWGGDEVVRAVRERCRGPVPHALSGGAVEKILATSTLGRGGRGRVNVRNAVERLCAKLERAERTGKLTRE